MCPVLRVLSRGFGYMRESSRRGFRRKRTKFILSNQKVGGTTLVCGLENRCIKLRVLGENV